MRIPAFVVLLPLLCGICLGFSSRQRHTRFSAWSLQSAADSDDDGLLRVMVNGMPGPMATAAAEACLRKGLKLAPVAMTGPDMEPCVIHLVDPISERSAQVKLIPSSDTESIEAAIDGIKTAIGAVGETGSDGSSPPLIAIDYTHPSAVNGNALFYAKNGVPFVMGTTGGDREKLISDVESANHFAVIAPNMAKQIVAMQATLEEMAKKFPGAFDGWQVDCIESHQKKKADTSGTAKAVLGSLKTLASSDFDIENDITMLRTDEDSLEFGVPEEGLDGHAFHTYTLTSPDGTVQFALEHNVVGRSIYAEGTADAVKFLAKKIAAGMEPKVFTMIEVLEEGALE